MKKKILIIDDSLDILEMTRSILQTRGYDILTLSDGSRVLETVRTQRPDLIVIDMLLPDKNGDQLCSEIKSEENLSHIPIIITTGQAIVEESSQEIPGMFRPDDYLSKPFEVDDLLGKIQDLLNK